jgi:hypothetical protein
MMKLPVFVEQEMTQPAKAPAETLPADPYPPYRPVYAWVFQAWLVMFLFVICMALIFYLYPHALALWKSIFG